MTDQHRVIPIFIPQRACPHRCTYCNQFTIAGQISVPTPEEAVRTIERHLATMSANAEVRVGFFGGSFTGLSLAEQDAYLQVVQPFIKSGQVCSIQLSTRPDYISPAVLDLLKRRHVGIIELGAQSLDDGILAATHRGHTAAQVEEASGMILKAGFQLGLQMMIGLPGDTKEKAMGTAARICELGATFTRIYPTLVVNDTLLAKQYEDGLYQPLALEEAVDWCKDLQLYFEAHHVQILRMGLHPSRQLLDGSGYLAGPFHVSFKELVLTAIWHDKIADIVRHSAGNPVEIEVPAGELNYAIGYGSANRKTFPEVKFKMRDKFL